MPHAPISASTNGTNLIVAGSPNKRIAVLNYTVIGANAVNFTWQSGATPISGKMAIGAAGGGVSPSTGGNSIDQVYLFETNPGDDLNLILDGAVLVGGHLTYTTFSG